MFGSHCIHIVKMSFHKLHSVKIVMASNIVLHLRKLKRETFKVNCNVVSVVINLLSIHFQHLIFFQIFDNSPTKREKNESLNFFFYFFRLMFASNLNSLMVLIDSLSQTFCFLALFQSFSIMLSKQSDRVVLDF